MTLTVEYYQQCCYLIYILLPLQSGSQTNWESASEFPLRSTHILANDSSISCPWCTQTGSPGQIKADSQCWCLVCCSYSHLSPRQHMHLKHRMLVSTARNILCECPLTHFDFKKILSRRAFFRIIIVVTTLNIS